MTYIYKNKGVCSDKTTVVLSENSIVEDIAITGGCNGNLQGIAALVKGQKAEDVIERLEGVRCGFRQTSCPDQIAQCLKEALRQRANESETAESTAL